MTQERAEHNTIAPLRNVSRLMQMTETLQSRPQGLPGLGVFYGPAGYGKTTAAIYVAQHHEAVLLSIGASWTAGHFCRKLLEELGGRAKGTIPDMVDRICEILIMRDCPLIIDEVDVAVQKRFIEYIREIYDTTEVPVILIGEEALPQKLRSVERADSRILDWQQALSANRQDLDQLAKVLCAGVTLSEPVSDKITTLARGSLRRMCTNLLRLRDHARTHGKPHVDEDFLSSFKLYSGEAPRGERVA